MTTEKKTGAYICSGCGLGERLDTAQLERVASRDCKVDYVKQHDFLCNADGVSTIRDDIENGTSHVVIAACSRRAKTDAFHFDNAALSRANLREGVIWARPDEDAERETTQEMADDYLRMACFENKFMRQPSSSREQSLNKNILVVGGGVSGLTAALEAARAGYAVTLVEKSGQLGGIAARLYRQMPSQAPHADPEETHIDALLAEVQAQSNIDVYLNSTIAKTAGAPGRFQIDIATENSTPSQAAMAHITVGAIVQTSGFKPYDARYLPEFAYGSSVDVVTQLELEILAKHGDGLIARPSDGKSVASVVFVQCAGQRSDKPNHLNYCSGFCCGTSIKQAMYFKDSNPDIDTTICYTDLRTPGVGGEDFYRSGQQKGIIFTKATVNEVIPSDSGLQVHVFDLVLAQDSIIEADLVVLATGMVANSGPDPYATPTTGGSGDATPSNEVKIPVESILNLNYRQGTDLPQLAHGFNDSHFICFPYETRRTGIYAAGPVRRPMDIPQTIDDATGAAMKAIIEAENAGKGMAAHPRSGDLSFPTFRAEGCTQCKRCTVECPFGAIDEDEKRYPVFNESRCRRCGTCMGACPVRVISFENYSIDTVGQQIKNIDMPDEFDEKPRVLVLACENDAYPALDMASQNGIHYSPFARVVPVRCLGSVSLSWITDALNSGYDGIVMMGCQKGANYQCHFVRGSEIAHERLGKVADTLESLSLEPERIAVHEVAITDIARAPQLINAMLDVVEKVGMSPFKF